MGDKKQDRVYSPEEYSRYLMLMQYNKYKTKTRTATVLNQHGATDNINRIPRRELGKGALAPVIPSRSPPIFGYQ